MLSIYARAGPAHYLQPDYSNPWIIIQTFHRALLRIIILNISFFFPWIPIRIESASSKEGNNVLNSFVI